MQLIVPIRRLILDVTAGSLTGGLVMSAAAVRYDMNDAKTRLARIVERVERGEEIIINRAGTPVAKVVPLVRRPTRSRRTGTGHGLTDLPVTRAHAPTPFT
jgi:prevent-host-death family protein